MNIFDLQATISLNSSGFESGVQNAQSAFGSLGDTIKGTAIGKLAADAVEKGASAVIGFGKDAIQTGMSFESAMSQIAATLGWASEDISENAGGVGDMFSALKETAATMGRETVFSATEAAEGLNILAMSGFSAEQSIEMLPTVLNLAAAGSMDMASAAGYVSGAMKGFADDTKDAQYYADLMAQGATLANTNVTQLGEAMSAGAAGAAAYGQSADSMTVALLRLAEQGQVGSAAGTALAAAMKDLYTPTDQAKDALAELGIAAYEDGKALDFNDIVNNLNKALEGFSEEEANAYKQTIFGIQGLNAYNKMTVTSTEKQEEWTESLRNASEGIGAAAQQYATMTDNLSGSMAGLSSAFDGLKNAVYEKLSGPLQKASTIAANALNEITAGFESGGLKGALASLGSFAQETLSGLWDNLKLPPELEGIAAKLEPIRGAMSGLAESVKPLAESFTDSLAEKVSGFASGVGNLISAFGKAEVDTISGVVSSVRDFIAGFANGGGIEVIEQVANHAADLFGAFVNASADIIRDIGNGVKAFLDAFPSEEVGGIIAEVAKHAGELFGAFGKITRTVISEVAGAVKTFLAGFDNKAAGNLIKDIADGAASLFGLFTSTLGGIINRVAEAFQGFGARVAELWNTAGPSLQQTGEAVKSVVQGIKQGVEDFLKFVEPVIEWLTTAFSVTIQIAFEQLIVAVGAAWNAIMNIVTAISDAFNGFVALLHGDVAGAAEAFKSAWENIVEFFQNIVDFIVGPFKVLGQKLGDEGDKGVRALKAPFEAAWNWFKDIGGQIIAGLKQGISDAWTGLTSWLSDKVSGLTDGIKNLFGIHSPSTVFAGIGENLVLGMREGWGDAFGGLERQIDRDMASINGTAQIGFENSALGKSSAAGISAAFAAMDGGRGGGDPIQINLVLDGDVAATALYDPLRRTAFQRGQSMTEAAAYA